MKEDIASTIPARVDGGNHMLLIEDTDRVIQVGNIADEKNFANPQRGRVYSPDGVSPCIGTCGGGNLEPKIISYSRDSKGKVVSRHLKDVANTLHASRFETTEQYVLEPRIVAMRGRNPDNPSERKRSNGTYRQRIEVGAENVSNTITTVQKDNMLLVLDQVKDMVKDRRPGKGATAVLEQDGTIRSCYNVGTHDASISEMIVQYEDNPAHTVTTAHHPKVYGDTTRFRIRKLTERECFRLMDVSEADIDKIQQSGVSRSQQYKCAGNSICVGVLYHIFRKMFVQPECESQQLSLF